MINIVQQLPINPHTSEVLCESWLQLKIMRVRYAQTAYEAKVIFECIASDTGKVMHFVASRVDNTIRLEDINGDVWYDKVIGVKDNTGYTIYTPQARSIMLSWIQSANQYGLIMMMLILGSVFIATQSIYVAMPFIGMALLALLGWSKEYRKVKRILRVWGEPDDLTV